MPNGLDKLAEGMGKAIETVPDLYDDALKPATQESGKTLALIPRAINAALVPLRQWIVEREYKLAETEKLLAKKLEHVGEDKIVTPAAYVAVPAIQAISYSMDSEELRNLYANLLAKAMNSDTKDQVHPSFVEVIKQMSPIDSSVFKMIMERMPNPLIDLIYKNDDGHSVTLKTNIIDIDNKITTVEHASVSIDNLIKQNLIFVPEDSHYSNERVYDKLIKSEYYLTQEQLYPPTKDGFKFTYKKRMIEKTNIGSSFYEICVKDL
ncbi:MAG: DUF4393 domain-containing protein [Lachnospiraceae bacterium]|nr:DUF4393 domain-containing protein [Lachnospiraceae bacterium]